ncbi:immunoglobulin superfamily member 3-like isoform X1 [Tachysurus vachellii]|uniref:immunoglobulin superfamily member 3-like isoform X1 n=1 Tax=Tachysurus vachellii TaxID=175792 RepID=UPI00296B003B|nr:immunoglobulin superfamily member 3-like isoform X1 [Tachysurus vachellii]
MCFLQPQLWHLLLMMSLGGLFQTDVCAGQQLVEIQEGPLYRVKGFPMSISCNVSGLKHSRTQDFAFSIFQPKKPEVQIAIISTFDPSYPYAKYSKRVREKNIVIERQSKTSVIFHIKSLEAEDSGEYECYTPNTDGVYFGTYSAKTTVKVIEDTLLASYSGPASLSVSVGESIQLECQVSSQTFQHTHLSVTWYLRGSTDTRPIISLDRDLTVRPGAEYEHRYHSGFITMEKIEDTTYRLKITQVQQSDSGEIYCQADEWIQDPDRSWMRICHRNSTGSNIEVKTLDTAHEEGSFGTQIQVLNGALEEGDMMEIHCRLEAQNLLGYFFSMTWLRNNMIVAQIDHSGVQTVDNTYMKREKDGELRTVKKKNTIFILTIQPVRVEDQGIYQCKAEQVEKLETGSFIERKSQLSHEETVHIRTKESSLAVVMTKQMVPVTEGETLQIFCSVSGTKGLLSVSWQHKKSSGSSFSDVITLSREGVMGDVGAKYQHRGVRTFRSNVADFILELSGALLSDSGEYMCTVSEWSIESNGNLKKVNSQSQQGQISVNSIESLVNVGLKSRDTSVTENSTIKMICSVKAPKVSLAVTWMFEPQNSTAQKNIICMDHTGSISCGAEQQDYQVETQVRESGTDFILKVLRASKRQVGKYKCQIDVYDKNVQKTKKLSNSLGIAVHRPDSMLSVSTSQRSPLKIQANSDGVINCLVSTATSDSSRFEVTWTRGTQTLLKMEPEGVVTLETDERISIIRTDRKSFQLRIQQVKLTDSGHYRCSVQEWIQDPDGIWYGLDTKSVTRELAVVEKESDFSMDKSNVQLKATEGEQVKLSCSLGPGVLDHTFRYSLSWFFQQDQSSSIIKLLTYSHDGRLMFQVSDPDLQHRLYFSRPTFSVFHLSILNSIPSDSGSYYCEVDQYQYDCKSKWERKASDKSGFSNVTVHSIESKLHVHKSSHFLNVTDIQTGFMVECEISSRSSEMSVLEVIWSRRQSEEKPLTIFTARRDGTLHSMIIDRTLVYDRPSTTRYTLTVPNVDPSDNGLYQCQVIEWLQIAANTWKKVAEDKSGELSINVVGINSSDTSFTLEAFATHQNTMEGEQLDISCFINFEIMDPTFHYSLTWFVGRQDSSTSTFLLSYTHNGLLQYQSLNQQLSGRLLFSRPTAKQFQLSILNSDPSDSGNYQCRVEQYQLNCEGMWEKKGSPQLVTTMVNVQKIESKLHVHKSSRFLNVTDIQTGFMVECEISSRSSEKSVLEVIWSRRQSEEKPLTIFTARRDGTLHSTILDRTLVYGRPSTTRYTLTVPNVDPSDNGQYQCQVIEWLQTAANTWRKVAEDKSGGLSVSVPVKAPIYDPGWSSGVPLYILVLLLFFLLAIVVILWIKLKKIKSASKKQEKSLWAENMPLSAVTETAAGKKDID